MVDTIPRCGDIKHLKRKRENKSQIPGKNFPGIFLPFKICKTVTNVTQLFAYINQ
jgi:hypothetical protein